MKNTKDNKIWQAYQKAFEMTPLIQRMSQFTYPLTYKDSFNPVPKHPFCAMGVLNAAGRWGNKKGIAFVVHDNCLLTCASNCYSDKHGEYPSITFTIKSSRKSGYDTYKVGNVIFPCSYKNISRNERTKLNYAFLYIKGQPNMLDKYGCIAIKNNKNETSTSEQLEDIISKQGYLQLCRDEVLQPGQSPVFSGWPFLYQDKAFGLIFWEEANIRPILLQFDDNFYSQLARWVQLRTSIFSVEYLQFNQADLSCFEGVQIKPIDKIAINDCDFEGNYFSFFEKLPFSDISQLTLAYQGYGSSNYIRDNIHFLKQNKFRNLKHLSIYHHQIGPIGCSILASLSLTNLRSLDLDSNPLRDQGCKNLSKAQWLFLGHLQLFNCRIETEGVQSLLQSKRINLFSLELGANKFNKDIQLLFCKVQLPRIENLRLGFNSINGNNFVFLKSSSWKRLKKLQLNSNLVGSKGCKILKQAELGLECLYLSNCQLDSTAYKWLCKANLPKISEIFLKGNLLGAQGCFNLSRAYMPKLVDIQLADNKIIIKGMTCLLQAQWAKQAIQKQVIKHYQKRICFQQLIKSFGSPILHKWLKI